MKQKQLRHPNVMSEAERLALPDPCRPIDTPVVPAGVTLEAFFGEAMLASATEQINKKPTQNRSALHQADTAHGLSSYPTHQLAQFIKEQQLQSQKQPCQLRLPLALVAKMVKEGGQALVETVMKNHPHFSLVKPSHDDNGQTDDELAKLTSSLKPSAPTEQEAHQTAMTSLEARIYLMGEMYQLMLSVFLLCQCKTRKTLNHQITLQDLTDAMNAYIDAHRIEVGFASKNPELIMDVKHVEFALLAMGWPMSKQANVAERVTSISANNPLTGC